MSLPQADAVHRAGNATHGGSALRFTVGPTNSPGATTSSAITLHGNTASLPTTDWSGQAAVGFDFFTDLPYDTTGRITIHDADGTAWGANYPIHTRGWTPVNAQLGHAHCRGHRHQLHLRHRHLHPRANKAISGYYDAFRLSDEFPYDQSGYGDGAASALLQLCGYGSILSGLSAQLGRLDRQVGHHHDAIDQRLAGLVHDEQDQVAALSRTPAVGTMSYDAYSTFNTAVAAAQRAVPRLADTIQARAEAPSSDFGLESADSMSLVYPKDLPFTSTGPSPTIRLAKGEYENVQAVAGRATAHRARRRHERPDLHRESEHVPALARPGRRRDHPARALIAATFQPCRARDKVP